ncbi:LOW QUALITY PROTEIN: hypothetical protein V2J09_013004 [Rumex salicifolius]
MKSRTYYTGLRKHNQVIEKDEWGGADIEVGSGNGSAQVDVDDGDKNLDLKRCLVDSVYRTDLGFQASPEVRAELSELVNQLEAANPTPNPTEDPALLDGNWWIAVQSYSKEESLNMPNGSHSLAITVAEALQVRIIIDKFLLAAEMSEDGSDLLGDCVPVIDVVDILMQEADDSIPKSTISGKPPRHPNSDHTSGSDCSADHAKCKYCSTLIGCLPKNGTTCLKNHVQRCKKFPANLDRTQKMIELDAEAIEGDNVFYDATLLLSGSRYVTCNTCVHHVFAIGLGISELCINEDEGVRKMAQQMKLKYDKYWGDVHNMNYLLFVSLLLDPRRKMQLVDWLIRQSFDATKAAVVNVNLMLLIGELFGKYASLVPKVQKEVVSSVKSVCKLFSGLYGFYQVDDSKISD